MKCIFFNPSQKIFIDKDNFDLNHLNNIEEIFISPFRKKETNYLDINMKDLTIQHFPINKIHTSLTDEQYYKLLNFIKKSFNINLNKNIALTFSHNKEYIDESSLDNRTIILREIKKNELKYWKYCLKGGAKKYNKIVAEINEKQIEYKIKKIKEDNDNENEEVDESENEENKKWDKNFKLLLYRIDRLKAELIFPNGDIFSLNKIPINDKDNLIYDVCHFSYN